MGVKGIQMTLDYKTILGDRADGLVLLAYRGSHSHGLYVPPEDEMGTDDVDLMGVVVPPLENYFGLDEWGSRGTKDFWVDQYDVVLYEFRKMISLLCGANPNVLSLLWLRQEFYVQFNELGLDLLTMRDKFMTKKLYKSFMGYAAAQLHKMERGSSEGYMGEKRKAIVREYGYDCYHEDTEFLTSDGWKKFQHISDGESLATVNVTNGTLEWAVPSDRFTAPYYGQPLYTIENRYTKCTVTDDHKMLTYPCSRSKENNWSTEYVPNKHEWSLKPLNELMVGKRSHFNVRTVPEDRHEFDISDDMLRLYGAFLAEGTFSFRDGEVKSLSLCQTPNGKLAFYDLMRSMPEQWGFKEYTYKQPKNATYWVTHNEFICDQLYRFVGHSKNKRLPKWIMALSRRQASIMLDAAILGDGTRIHEYAHVYYSGSKQVADWVQILAMIAGRQSIMWQYEYDDIKIYQVYILNEVTGPGSVVLRQSHHVTRTEPYYGNVVCFTVPNGTLITRLDGKIAIQGNTKNAAHCIRLLRMGVEALETGQLNVYRERDRDELLAIKRGEWALERVKAEAEAWFDLAHKAMDRCKLPEDVDRQWVNDFCRNQLSYHFFAEPRRAFGHLVDRDPRWPSFPVKSGLVGSDE